MRYSASEKAEIIRLVGQSALPVKRTLEKLSIPGATPRPDRVWNRIPDDSRERIVQLALDEPTLSPRELAVRFTDTESYFVSETSVYRRGQTILIERERIKRQTIANRRLLHRRQAA
jgi:hypothetical protein